jgi:hypothetical protein
MAFCLTDSMHTGDFRDGDGQWYKFRTQGFCANAAFSLYGVKKGHVGSGCSGKTYINSFFTYDGADMLLNAVGKSPEIYWGDAVNQDIRSLQNNDKDDEYQYREPNNDFNYGGNAYCVTMDDGFGDGGRELNSGDNYNDGYSSALGCNSHNHYIMAGFKGSACDGNYFLKSLDSMSTYNSAMNEIGCHAIWSNSGADDYSNEAVYKLLKDSWACDYRLYPNECPDPYGEKKRYEHALKTHSNGGNALVSFHHYGAAKPMQTTSWVFLSFAAALFGYSYYLKNQIANKGKAAKATDDGVEMANKNGAVEDYALPKAGEKNEEGVFT